MTTQTQAAAPQSAPAAEAAPKALADLPTAPQIFNSFSDANAWLAGRIAEGYDFSAVPIVSQGLDSEGGLDPEAFPARVSVHILRNRAVRIGDTLQPAAVKCVAIYHLPTIETAIATPDAREWISTVLNTAMTRKAVAKLRDADNLLDVADSLPTDDADYWAEAGRGGSGLETFDAVYGEIRALVMKFPVAAKSKISKADFKRALESRAFALALYPACEELKIGTETRSLFLAAAVKGRALAVEKGLSPAIFDRWIETRDQVEIEPATDEAEAEPVDFDAIFG